MLTNKDLADILVCPQCKGDLILTEKGDGLSCVKCMLTYPIKEGIPIMVVEEATLIKNSL